MPYTPGTQDTRPAPPTAPEPAALAPFLPGIALRRTVLLVEDSRLAADAVRLICGRAGLRLRRAETLDAAEQHLRLYRPDIALIDLGLPDGSGLNLIERLARQRPRIGRIVAVSGDPELRMGALRAGADAFVEKPLRGLADLATITGPLFDAAPDIVSGAARVAERPIIAPCAAEPGGHLADAATLGADPLALRDDLRRARALLCETPEPARIGYAAQFLSGIARSLDDAPLLAMAEHARLSGEPAPLIALLRERVAAQPML